MDTHRHDENDQSPDDLFSHHAEHQYADWLSAGQSIGAALIAMRRWARSVFASAFRQGRRDLDASGR